MEALKRAAASPSAQTRRVAAITIGVILEAAVYVPSGWPDDHPGIAVAAGILIAALAGAVGGVWSGLAVAGAGWGFHYFFVSQDDLPPLIGLPAWLAVGALAGWLSTTRRRTARARAHLARELGTVRDASSEAIVAVDAEGTIVSWSRGAEELYGYDADDASGALSRSWAERTSSHPRSWPCTPASTSTSRRPLTGARAGTRSPSR